MQGPNHFDEDTGFWLSGIDVLIHEWTHVILGDFHVRKACAFCPMTPVEEAEEP